MTTIAHTQPQMTMPPQSLRPVSQTAANKLQAAHLGSDHAKVSGRRGSLPMKPVVIGSLAATATAVVR
jgi:hypothetical protein